MIELNRIKKTYSRDDGFEISDLTRQGYILRILTYGSYQGLHYVMAARHRSWAEFQGFRCFSI
jgi:hypothetical protein